MLMASGCPATSNSELVHMRAASMPTGLARFAQRVATSPRPCACVTRTLQSAAVLASSGFHSEPVFAILQMFAKFCQILPNFNKDYLFEAKITFSHQNPFRLRPWLRPPWPEPRPSAGVREETCRRRAGPHAVVSQAYDPGLRDLRALSAQCQQRDAKRL